jgi:hypothetical protein
VLDLDSSTCSSFNWHLFHKSANNLTVAGQEKRTVNSDDRHVHFKFPISTLLNFSTRELSLSAAFGAKGD